MLRSGRKGILVMKNDKEISKDEVVGYIKVISSPSFVSKRAKYRVEIRASKPIKALKYDDFEVLGHFVRIVKRRKIKRLLGRLGKVVEQYDKEEGTIFYHYLFYVDLPLGVKLSEEDVADGLKSHLEINEGCKIQSVAGVKMKLFPWEKDKVLKKVPLTKAAFDAMIERMKKKQNNTNEIGNDND